MVFNRTEELNNNFNPDTNLIGIRIPDHDFLRQALDVVIKVLQLCRKVVFFFEAQKFIKIEHSKIYHFIKVLSLTSLKFIKFNMIHFNLKTSL